MQAAHVSSPLAECSSDLSEIAWLYGIRSAHLRHCWPRHTLAGKGKHARFKMSHGIVQESSEAGLSSEEESDQESSAPAAPVLTEHNDDISARSPALKGRLGRGRTRGAARQTENVQPA